MAEKKVTKNDLFWTFVRSNFLLGSFNFERMQAIGFCVSMIPILKRGSAILRFTAWTACLKPGVVGKVW